MKIREILEILILVQFLGLTLYELWGKLNHLVLVKTFPRLGILDAILVFRVTERLKSIRNHVKCPSHPHQF